MCRLQQQHTNNVRTATTACTIMFGIKYLYLHSYKPLFWSKARPHMIKRQTYLKTLSLVYNWLISFTQHFYTVLKLFLILEIRVYNYAMYINNYLREVCFKGSHAAPPPRTWTKAELISSFSSFKLSLILEPDQLGVCKAGFAEYLE